MKFTNIASSIALLASLATASPTPTVEDGLALDPRTVEKRASITEACNIGFCTQNGGTTGGTGGTTTTVSTLAQFTAAAQSSAKMVIVLKGALSGSAKVKVGSNKSIIGAAGSSLTGIGLTINKQSNVIVRNMKITKVLAANGDAISIQESKNVWVDHCDLSADRTHGKDFYDGLVDITHAAEFVTVSNTFIHDHFKGSLVGHSDSNGAEDTGHLHVTFANNRWDTINSRGPSVRFGTAHIFNCLYSNMGESAINTRMGAQVLVESTVFENSATKAIFFADSDKTGFAVANDVAFGGGTNTAPKGTLTTVPYQYTKLGSANVKTSVVANAGQKLAF